MICSVDNPMLLIVLTSCQQIAQHALTILVNIAADAEVLKFLASDDKFLDVIFSRITVRYLPSPLCRGDPGLWMRRLRCSVHAHHVLMQELFRTPRSLMQIFWQCCWRIWPSGMS